MSKFNLYLMETKEFLSKTDSDDYFLKKHFFKEDIENNLFFKIKGQDLMIQVVKKQAGIPFLNLNDFKDINYLHELDDTKHFEVFKNLIFSGREVEIKNYDLDIVFKLRDLDLETLPENSDIEVITAFYNRLVENFDSISDSYVFLTAYTEGLSLFFENTDSFSKVSYNPSEENMTDELYEEYAKEYVNILGLTDDTDSIVKINMNERFSYSKI